MALTANLKVRLAATLTNVLDLNTAKDKLDFEKTLALTNGTGANQGDLLFHDQRTLSASATENLDLAGGLTDAFGATLTFVRLNMLIVFAAAANTNDVQVSRTSSNGAPIFLAASDGLALPPGGIFVFSAGDDDTDVVITAGTGDLLTFTNSAGGSTVTYDVILVGATA